MAEEKRIKVLASDIGGVIALFRHNVKPGSLKDFADWLNYLTQVPSDEWQKFLDYIPGTPEYDFIAGKIEPKRFYWKLRDIANAWHQTARHRAKAPFPNFRLFKRAWCNIFATNIELLARLRDLSKIYKVVLASNLDIWHYKFLWDLCDLNFVDEKASVVSFRDHVVKPDPAFFELLIRNCGVEPGEIFFFDDRVENCESAFNCGIEIYQYVDNASFFRELEKRNIVKYLEEKD